MTISVHELTVGPIVGVTRPTSARLWGRGELRMDDDGAPERCFGVIRREGGTAIKPFKMLPHFDFTGVVEWRDLRPGADYAFELGYVYFDGELTELAEAADELVWPDEPSIARVRTAPGDDVDTSFVFGSCRYLLRFMGGWLHDARGDKTFRSILKEHVADEEGRLDSAIDLLLMTGDQIYADDAAMIAPDTTLDEFFQRYRFSFQRENIRELMSRVPTYMILDDHEIDDNWSQDRLYLDGEDRALYAAATHAYECYQVVHGPAIQFNHAPKELPDDKPKEPPSGYWYEFDHGRSAFFVMDTRTERFADFDPPQMIGREQMEALKSWLTRDENAKRWKFLVSSVPFFPDSKSSDKWGAYVEQRNAILDFVRARKVEKVVILSGDVHCSMTSKLVCDGDPDFEVYSVVSSSFFWPYPHGQAFFFRREGPLERAGTTGYKVERTTEVISRDNFTRIDVEDDELTVRFFERKGDPIDVKFRDASGSVQPNVTIPY